MDSTQERLIPHISLRDTLRVFFRYKWRAIGGMAVVLVLSAAAILVAPRQYVSEARVLVRLGAESVRLEPTASIGETLSISDSRESELQTAIDMLANRRLKERVVEMLGAEAVLQQRAAVSGSTPADAQSNDGIDRQELAIKRLESSLDWGAEKRSSVIWIRCFTGSPELSQQVLDAFTRAYIEEHVKAHRSPESQRFFEEQETLLRQRLLAANNQLRDAKNEVGLMSVEVERTLIEKQISTLTSDINTAEADLLSAEDRLNSLAKKHPDMTRTLTEASASGLSIEAINQMRGKLYELQLQEQELASRFTDLHPRRRYLRRQVQESQQILDRQEYLIEASRVAGGRSRLSSLNEKLEHTIQRLRDLNRGEVHINELEQQVALLKKSLATYQESREVARIDANLATSRITNLALVQEPSLQRKAVSPRKSLVAALGVLAALLTATGLPLASSVIDNTYSTPEHLHRELSLPVLVSIPETPRHRLLLR